MAKSDILHENARFLRKHMTNEEKKLWYQALSRYPVRWYRQKVIGLYIADFYCHRAKLVVELDGNQHFTEAGKIYDENRTAYLESHGIDVLRFKNFTVQNDFWWVCNAIRNRVNERLNLIEGRSMDEISEKE
ncbi:MAG: DUF559 domain-containing protein [Thermoguttaceae bacterium]|nr:DUF559 domain-containing protein [Thermoguttaceae bacterium]MBP3695172.1 DUF559 domain-containing protein [Thermoguttaceae bacterium]